MAQASRKHSTPPQERQMPAAGPVAAPPRAEEPRPQRAGIVETAIRRVMDVLDEETHALRSGMNADLKSFNERKSLGLIELNRALRLIEGTEPDRTTRGLLDSLNEKLAVNRHVLTIHLEAVREVAGIISRSIREADSDGTYTFAFRSKGRTP